MRRWLMLLGVYALALPTPRGQISTSLVGHVLRVGDWEHVLPDDVDPYSIRGKKIGEYVVLQFTQCQTGGSIRRARGTRPRSGAI